MAQSGRLWDIGSNLGYNMTVIILTYKSMMLIIWKRGVGRMGFKFAYSTLRWKEPNFEELLFSTQEGRLGWLGNATVFRLGRYSETYSPDV